MILNIPKYPPKCVACGQFIAYEKIGHFEFTPDTHFTSEKSEYWCENCAKKEENQVPEEVKNG